MNNIDDDSSYIWLLIADLVDTELSSLEWHTITVDEALRRLSSSATHGLSPDQVARKFKEFGRNAPTPPKSNALSKYLGYLFKGFGPVLLVGAVLVFVSWKPLGEPNPAVANLVRMPKVNYQLLF